MKCKRIRGEGEEEGWWRKRAKKRKRFSPKMAVGTKGSARKKPKTEAGLAGGGRGGEGERV